MSEIEDIFRAFSKKKVLVIGDVMIDHYIDGDVNRISPEAPLPIVDVTRRYNKLGGAANVALNLKELGAEVLLYSYVGKDKGGDDIVALMKQEGLNTKGILREESRQTTVKTRLFSRKQQLLRFDEEDRSPLKHSNETYFTDLLFSVIDRELPDVIVFQDYNKGVLGKKTINKVLQHAVNKDIPTVVDPKFSNFFEYIGCTVFKPNLKEAEKGLGITIDAENLDEIKAACKKITKELNNHTTVLTLGSKGIYVYSNSKGELSPSLSKKVYDVSGAGDTVAAVICIGVALNIPMSPIAELANIAAEQVCSEVGVVPVNKKALIAYAKELLD